MLWHCYYHYYHYIVTIIQFGKVTSFTVRLNDVQNHILCLVFQDYLKNYGLEVRPMSDYVISAITNGEESNVELLVSK